MAKESEKVKARRMNNREVSHVLAALRLWQKDRRKANKDFYLTRVATNGGEHELMDEDEIDALCRSLDCEEVY